jgi:hypothetical protein
LVARLAAEGNAKKDDHATERVNNATLVILAASTVQ